MDNLEKELDRLESRANLQGSINETQTAIEQLQAARQIIAASETTGSAICSSPLGLADLHTDESTAQKTLLTAQCPIKQRFEKMNDNLKDVYNGLNKLGKAVKEKFREMPLPFAEEDTLENISTQPSLINRAVAMHLLREGLFDVASAFIQEANANPPASIASIKQEEGELKLSAQNSMDALDDKPDGSWTSDFSPTSLKSTALQQHFSSMYQIVDAMRSRNDLTPAIAWARSNSDLLEARGSNLEFELCRLQYIELYNGAGPQAGPLAAIAYARATFPSFPSRYAPQIRQLLGALAFAPNVTSSPYAGLFATGDSESSAANSSAASAFTSEFCALLSLSSASPLFTAVTAGCIALPTLAKFAAIARQVGTSWTTSVELPVEVPLPPGYVFHSVFVCPVSKEQATDRNPPMMMPCGHVVAKESLESMSSGRRFKCPYCPGESVPSDAMRLFL